MQLLKLTLAIGLLVAILCIFAIRFVPEPDYSDADCVNRCLVTCFSDEDCRLCYDVLLSLEQYELYDPGAYPESPLGGSLTWRVRQPWAEPTNETEREALSKAKELIEELRRRSEGQDK